MTRTQTYDTQKATSLAKVVITWGTDVHRPKLVSNVKRAWVGSATSISISNTAILMQSSKRNKSL